MGTSRVVTLSRAIMSPQREILDRLTGTRHLVGRACVWARIRCGNALRLDLGPATPSMLPLLSRSLLSLVTPSYYHQLALACHHPPNAAERPCFVNLSPFHIF